MVLSLPTENYTKLTEFLICYMIMKLGGFMKSKENEILKSLRIKHGYTYQDMADILQICKAYYWQIEHKNRRLSYDMAKKIAQIFGLRPDDIFYDETN